MNGFWKRRLPAVLLALTLVVSLLPAALAADNTHQYNTSTWQRAAGQRQPLARLHCVWLHHPQRF